jgi:hypothetical protein
VLKHQQEYGAAVNTLFSVRRWRLAIIAGALAVLATACVTDLTTQYGDRALMQDSNDSGVMVGYSGSAMLLSRFQPGAAPTVLGSVDGEGVTFGTINDMNEIVGTVNGQDLSPGALYPVAWDADGHAIDLRPMIPHAGTTETDIYAVDLNDNGLLLGVVYGVGGPLLFTLNIRTQAYTPIPPRAGAYALTASAMNNDGTIVGVESGPDGSQPTRWTLQGGTYVGEPLPDGFAARDINDAGDMVGYVPNVVGLAVLKAGAAAPVALAQPADHAYSMLSPRITETGIVAASAFASGTATAVRWATVDATPELMRRGTWDNIVFMDINDQGVALVSAFRDGSRHSLRWTTDA